MENFNFSYLALGILLTAFFYLLFPVAYILVEGKEPAKKARKIALVNSLTVGGIFFVIEILIGSKTNPLPAILYYFIAKAILTKKEVYVPSETDDDKSNENNENKSVENIKEQEEQLEEKKENLEIDRTEMLIKEQELKKKFGEYFIKSIKNISKTKVHEQEATIYEMVGDEIAKIGEIGYLAEVDVEEKRYFALEYSFDGNFVITEWKFLEDGNHIHLNYGELFNYYRDSEEFLKLSEMEQFIKRIELIIK